MRETPLSPVEAAIDRYHSTMVDMSAARVARELASRDLDDARVRYDAAMARHVALQDASDSAKEALRNVLTRALDAAIEMTQEGP